MDQVTLNKQSLATWQEQDLEQVRYDYDLSPTDTVLDIGSYRREWGAKIQAMYGCHVEFFDALDNRAAWLFDGELEMGGAFYYTSMFAEKKPFVFTCVDIAPYLQDKVALVKINIEGGEYKLIDYIIETGCIGNITNLQVQFHLIEGANSEKEYELLAKRLSVTHNLVWRYAFCWENWEKK